MAFSKIIFNGTTLMDVTQDTVEASVLLKDETATDASGTHIVGTYEGSAGTYQSKSASFTPTTSTQTQSILPDTGYDALSAVNVTVSPIPSAYIIPSGTLSITANGTGINVGSYASVDVSVAGGGGGDDAAASILDRTISGTYSNASVEKLGSYAFANCSKINSVSMPNCSWIANNAFYQCYLLSNVSFPKCEGIGSSAFIQCSSLTSVNMSLCTQIRISAFTSCSNLKTISFPSCTYMSSGAFLWCEKLEYVNLPLLRNIPNQAFRYCASLSYGYFAACIGIASYGLGSCTAMHTLMLSGYSSTGMTIQASTMTNCRKLLSLYLLASGVYSLVNINAFANTPISTYTTYTDGVNGSIFVPASLYDTYISATNWATYSERFVSLTSAEIAALNFG